MTIVARNEEDVLATNLAFHLAQGVDFFVITDHLSEDATPDIIRQFELAGLARGLTESSEGFGQAAWVTRMARLAADEHGADWVINNDADEFWWPTEGDLTSTFAELDASCDVVSARRHDFVPLATPRPPFHRSMVVRNAESYNVLGHPLPPKVAHRASADVVVGAGNHRVDLGPGARVADGPLEVFHFPFRTREQFIDKIVVGAAAVERDADAAPWEWATWRHLGAEHRRDGLVEYCRRASYTDNEIAAGLSDGSLVTDRRLADYLESMSGPLAG